MAVPDSALAAGETVQVTIGVLPPGKTVVISYGAEIEGTIPAGASSISNQGTVSFNEGTEVATGDPDETGAGDPLDPTLTPAHRDPLPPIAGPDTIERFSTQSVKVAVAILLGNDSSPDGNSPLTITAVNYTGGNGATVTLGGDTVFYSPNGYTGVDSFEYTLRDSLGLESIGSVDVQLTTPVGQTPNGVNLEMLPNGDVEVTHAGIPGRQYRVQSSGDLIIWLDRGTVEADAQGKIVFTDPAPVPPVRFYRTIVP